MFFFDNARRPQRMPDFFRKDAPELAREIASYLRLPKKERLQTDPPMVWKRPIDHNVLDALRELSHGKCAFCERVGVELQAYRFRPPFNATPLNRKRPEERICYIWLALDWSNFYPICRDCLPSEKSHFPVRGKRAQPVEGWEYAHGSQDHENAHRSERAQLVHPGELERPQDAFHLMPSGEMEAKTKKFAETIEHFRLNREELVRERRSRIDEALESTDFGVSPMSSGEFDVTTPFAGTLAALTFQIASGIAAFFGSKASRTISDAQALLRRQSGDERFESALRDSIEEFRAGTDASTAFTPAVRSGEPAGPKLQRLTHSRLRSIRIDNFKSLEHVTLELPEKLEGDGFLGRIDESRGQLPQAPCLLILGENATGKSSLLEAITLALTPASQRKQVPGLSPASQILAPEYMGAADESQAPDEARIELEFYDNRRSELRISRSLRSGFDGPLYSGGLKSDNGPLVFAYGAHRLYSKHGTRSKTRHVDTLFSNEKRISNTDPWLSRLERQNRSALNEVVAALRHVIEIDGEFESIEARQDGGKGSRRHCIINVKRPIAGAVPDPDGVAPSYTVPQRLDIASSSYRAVIALVCDIFYGLLEAAGGDAEAARMAHAIVLIDEIEAHLHPRWKITLLQRLRRALPRTTFIVTSHDPLCIRGMLPGEVVIMNRYQAGSDSQMFEAVEPFRPDIDIGKMTVEQLLTSDFLQLLSVDDEMTEDRYRRALAALAKQKRDQSLSQAEQKAVDSIRDEIAEALPYGRTEIPLLVQKTVAEYLAERRRLSPRGAAQKRQKLRMLLRNSSGNSSDDFFRPTERATADDPGQSQQARENRA